MACKRWSFSSKYSYSIGRVIGFKAKKDIASGLTVELTDGYKCYNKHSFKMIPAKTIIDMICDIDAGVGVPMPIDNKTGIYHCLPVTLSLCQECQAPASDWLRQIRHNSMNGRIRKRKEHN